MRALQLDVRESELMQQFHYDTEFTPVLAADEGDMTYGEELMCAETLRQLERTAPESCKQQVFQIRSSAVQSTLEPDKLCLQVRYTKRSKHGRLWGSYPAMM